MDPVMCAKSVFLLEQSTRFPQHILVKPSSPSQSMVMPNVSAGSINVNSSQRRGVVFHHDLIPAEPYLKSEVARVPRTLKLDFHAAQPLVFVPTSDPEPTSCRQHGPRHCH